MNPSQTLNQLLPLTKTRLTAKRYFTRLRQVGVEAHYATIISQALARLRCEQVPLNVLQKRALQFYWHGVIGAGLVRSRKVIPFCNFVKRP
ncbi:MAG: hypothetical protein AAGF01_17345 [Cyanobacteria bacterium P01_G01_bin.38]